MAIVVLSDLGLPDIPIRQLISTARRRARALTTPNQTWLAECRHRIARSAERSC